MEIYIIFMALCSTTVAILAAFFIRLIYLICQILTTESKLMHREASLRTILCMGSGGHTTELLRIMKRLDTKKFSPRLYVIADNDVSSEARIHMSENGNTSYTLCRIPRSRNVNQSYTSSIFSTLQALMYTIPTVYNFKPNIILCNGPGTCVPVCVIAFILRCLFILDCRIVFIESICRVRTMSLTGKVLQYFADIVVVQWPQLRDLCFRAKYFGRLS